MKDCQNEGQSLCHTCSIAIVIATGEYGLVDDCNALALPVLCSLFVILTSVVLCFELVRRLENVKFLSFICLLRSADHLEIVYRARAFKICQNLLMMATAAPDNEKGEDLLEVYLREAESVISKCRELQHIKGMHKLEKNCRAELKYLLSLKKKSSYIHESQLKSSNLCHFAGILHTVQVIPNVTRVMKPFHMEHRSESLNVDVVAGQGEVWVKVIARKAQSLHLIWAGQGQFGERDLVKQAADYVNCAELHPVNFLSPKVNFAFYSQVTEPMAEALNEKGIKVWGQRVKVNPDVEVKVQSIRSLFLSSDDESDNEDSDYYCDEEDDIRQSVYQIHHKQENVKENHSSTYSNEGFGEYLRNHLDYLEDKKHMASAKSRKEIYNSGEHFKKQSAGQDIDTELKLHCSNSDIETSTRVSPSQSIAVCDRTTVSMIQSPSKNTSALESTPYISSLLVSLPEFEFSEMIPSCHQDSVDHSASNVKGRVNLDITTMITLVSSVCHGGCHFVFADDLLTRQAKEEMENPALPPLQAFLKGKELFVCQSALKDFNTILQTLGGENEKQRATELMKRITIVSDHPSDKARNLVETGKIKERSKIIFGTGDYLKAITTSANVGFIRAAKHQGANFAVHIHPSRALTEQEEKNATRTEDCK